METLNALQMERDKKIENVGLFVKNAKSDAEAIAAEIKRLTERKRVLENKAEGAKEWLKLALAGEKFTAPKVAISFRNTESVKVDEIGQIPEQFLRYKEPEADKTAIKQAIKAGEEVPGAHIEASTSITIK